MDCHAGKSARNDDRLDSKSVDSHEAATSHDDKKLEPQADDSHDVASAKSQITTDEILKYITS